MEQETIAQQIQKLRDEIISHNSDMMAGMRMITSVMVLLFIAATVIGNLDLYSLVLVAAVTIPLFVARQDYLIHRAAAYIRYVEEDAKPKMVIFAEQDARKQQVLSWETWKGNLKSRKWLLPILDLSSPMLAATMAAMATNVLRHAGYITIGYLCWVLIVIGIVIVALTPSLAAK
jgi:hypothetical protein